jgi:hypothetical protein
MKWPTKKPKPPVIAELDTGVNPQIYATHGCLNWRTDYFIVPGESGRRIALGAVVFSHSSEVSTLIGEIRCQN